MISQLDPAVGPPWPAGRPPAESERRTGGRVLAVDHDPESLVGLAHALRDGGYDCRSVSTGTEALAAATGAAWDVALLDLDLPGVAGLDLLVQLHQVRPSCDVIAVSARDEARAAVAALRAGAQDYLTRPVGPDQLLAAVDHACQQRDLRRQTQPPAPSPRPNEAGTDLPRLIRLEDVIRRHVLEIFRETRDNVTRTALALGISRVALRRRLREYGVKPPP
jgi:DNA-binding NtrC family response regulator